MFTDNPVYASEFRDLLYLKEQLQPDWVPVYSDNLDKKEADLLAVVGKALYNSVDLKAGRLAVEDIDKQELALEDKVADNPLELVAVLDIQGRLALDMVALVHFLHKQEGKEESLQPVVQEEAVNVPQVDRIHQIDVHKLTYLDVGLIYRQDFPALPCKAKNDLTNSLDHREDHLPHLSKKKALLARRDADQKDHIRPDNAPLQVFQMAY
eukprot:gene13449-13563_t